MNRPEKPSSSTPPVAGGFPDDLEALLRAEESDPSRVLGPHWVVRDGQQSLAIRAFRPDVRELSIVWSANHKAYPARLIDPAGVFEAVIAPGELGWSGGEVVPPSAYRLRFRTADGAESEAYDAYAFPPILTEYDLYLLGEGTHYLNYEKLGSHVREVAGITGVHFGVWAPNAKRVSVVGDFNSWDGRVSAMRSRGASGIWEISLFAATHGPSITTKRPY